MTFKKKNIIVLGIGNVLFSDDGFGVRVVEALCNRYCFDENVSLIDGGVLGINLMGIMLSADVLIVADAIKNNGNSGDVYVIRDEKINDRMRLKNSLHQVDFLESFAICQIFNKIPNAVIIGVEPKDVITFKAKLTTEIFRKIDVVIDKILKELKNLNVKYKKKKEYKNTSISWDIKGHIK